MPLHSSTKEDLVKEYLSLFTTYKIQLEDACHASDYDPQEEEEIRTEQLEQEKEWNVNEDNKELN